MDLKLNNVEYIAIKMQENPGMPGRWYRKQLMKYKGWKRFKPVHYSHYFDKVSRSDRVMSNYGLMMWRDRAQPTVRYHSWLRGGWIKKPVRSEWHLTRAGWRYANDARIKLGLDPKPWPDAID
jgi:hypothetical protein